MDNWKAADLSTIRHPRPLHELLTKAGTEDAIIFQMKAPLPLALCTPGVVALAACSNGAADSAPADNPTASASQAKQLIPAERPVEPVAPRRT
ncbi:MULTISPECIES: hypothetical protein [unclassified Streptomyces]|uniref:hypothetical protein n=1 Tax=unclassified Streptomyces TaxID=2593676 RepID=UPI00381E1942